MRYFWLNFCDYSMNIKEFKIEPSLKNGFVYYAINNRNNKIYIGLTTNSLASRKKGHISRAKKRWVRCNLFSQCINKT